MSKVKTEKANPNTEVQNRFTAYIHVAATRNRIKYMEKQRKKYEKEIPAEDIWDCEADTENTDFLRSLPLEEQIEDQRLARSIKGLSEQDYQILCLRFLHELKFSEIADILGIKLHKVRHRYYGIAKKLQQKGGRTYGDGL